MKNSDELKGIVRARQTAGQRVVLANGCFDLLHVGHIRYLQAAREAGDVLVVALNSDRSVARNKGKGRPLMPQIERAELISELECVDYVVLFEQPSVADLLRDLRPDIHAKGTDYEVASVPERQVARSLGIETLIVGDPKNHSTTELIDTIRSHRS